MPEKTDEKIIVLGKVSGVHGVKGWLKIYSYTRPRDNIFSYPSWMIEKSPGNWQGQKLLNWKSQGKGLIAEFEGVEDRNEAGSLVGFSIGVERSELPKLEGNEYYWCDLIGLEVHNQQDRLMGKVVEIRETGANDVLVVEGTEKYFIPWLKGDVVKAVDLEKGRMLVDWDGEYI